MDIRDLTPDDLGAALDVRNRSFGPLDPARRGWWTSLQTHAAEQGRLLGAFQGGRLAATARIMAFNQWWGGRSLPMAGIGGVVVAPEDRGRGVGAALMVAVLDRAGDQRFPVSALYPATTPPYRRAGYELAGSRYTISVPSDAVRRLTKRSDPVVVWRARTGDAAEVVATIGRLHARHRDHGPFDDEPRGWAEVLEDENYFGYLAADGFVGFAFDGSDALRVSHLVAGSERTLRTFWGLVGSGSSVAPTVRACVGPEDPVWWLLADCLPTMHTTEQWMLRIVDLETAIAGRGFPPNVEADVGLRVTDEQRPQNSGSFRVRVSAGQATLTRVKSLDDGLEVGARGLAALFAGVRVATLRRAGLVVGGTEERDAVADVVFAADAFMLVYF